MDQTYPSPFRIVVIVRIIINRIGNFHNESETMYARKTCQENVVGYVFFGGVAAKNITHIIPSDNI